MAISKIGSDGIAQDANTILCATSGNVGIGTSSPSVKLDLSVTPTNSTTVQAAKFINTGNGVNTGTKISVGYSGQQAEISGFYDGSACAMGFNAGGSERMRIDSSGNLLVGTTNTNPIASRVNGMATGPVGFVTLRGTNNMALGLSTNSGSHITFYTDNGSSYVGAGTITSNGSTTAFNTGSDYRMKDNVQPMVGALNTVLRLNPVTYTWKPEFAGTKTNGQGFIAHELQAVVPDCVTGEKDAVDADGNPVYQGVDTSFLVATLTKAIQELNDKIEAQAAEIAALKGAA